METGSQVDWDKVGQKDWQRSDNDCEYSMTMAIPVGKKLRVFRAIDPTDPSRRNLSKRAKFVDSAARRKRDAVRLDLLK